MNNWKPISGAPEDRPILIYTKSGNMYVGQWCKNAITGDEAYYIFEQNDEKFICTTATHFMELPDAPNPHTTQED